MESGGSPGGAPDGPSEPGDDTQAPPNNEIEQGEPAPEPAAARGEAEAEPPLEAGNAVSMLLAVLEGGEVESESTNDEQQMSDVLGSGDPLVGAR